MNKILFKTIEGKGKFFLNGDLKNGEIVNPEVLNIDYEEMQDSGHSLKDGDTFDLPEGMGFKEGLDMVRLLTEKPEQVEEQERGYARHKDYADSFYNKGFNEAIEEVKVLAKKYRFLTFFEEIEKLKR